MKNMKKVICDYRLLREILQSQINYCLGVSRGTNVTLDYCLFHVQFHRNVTRNQDWKYKESARHRFDII